MDFKTNLAKAVQRNNTTLCVGLDPNLELLPNAIKRQQQPDLGKVEQFLKTVVDRTSDYCTAYKPNMGFFEALGPDGWKLFSTILNYLPEDKIVIADAKRGDISSTAEHYAKAFFEHFEVDAITLNPLMGFETLDPFLGDSSKGLYVLTLTSNPGASDILLQNLAEGQTISTYIAQRLAQKQKNSPAALSMVVGATKAEKLQPVISKYPDAPLLIPGIGSQGGSVDALVSALDAHSGIPLINSSRSIIYAGRNQANWPESVARAAKELKQQLTPITKKYVR